MRVKQSTTLVSSHFPYIPIRITFRNREERVEALLDTGFDGDIILPEGFIENGEIADDYNPWRMADGSIIHAAAYRGRAEIGKKKIGEVLITVLGTKPLIGRNIIANFKITLDHGKRVIVE